MEYIKFNFVSGIYRVPTKASDCIQKLFIRSEISYIVGNYSQVQVKVQGRKTATRERKTNDKWETVEFSIIWPEKITRK